MRSQMWLAIVLIAAAAAVCVAGSLGSTSAAEDSPYASSLDEATGPGVPVAGCRNRGCSGDGTATCIDRTGFNGCKFLRVQGNTRKCQHTAC